MPTRLGTAEWASSEAVAEKHPFETGKFWLGRADDGTPIGYHDDRHICLVSGSRGGKGTTTIINNLCLWPGSIVVVDPKGENASVTATRRGPGSEHCEGMGQSVHVLDPFKVAHIPDELRACFNPLDALDPENEESIDEAGRIADALVVINTESKDPYWDESARSMVKGLILHILTAQEFEGRRNLVTLRELVTRGDWMAVEALRQMGEEDIASGQALLWEGVRSNMAFGGIIAGIGESFANLAANSAKQFESVLQVTNRNTEFIDSPGMRRCLSGSDFALSDLKTKREGVSLYLSLPQRYMSTHYRWLRMMIALTVTEMEKVREKPATGHRVLMCLDEFAGLKRMEVIESAVAQIASFGVTLFFVLQSLEQLKATYKDNWETFLSNSGLKVFFNVEEHFSREYVSKFIGETELIREVRSASQSDTESESRAHTDSRSTSRSRSENRSTSSSRSHGQTGGTSSSTNRSEGGSEGMSWRRHLYFFRRDKQYNKGNNWSNGRSDGINQGWSASTTAGVSQSFGFSTSETTGTSDTTTQGTSRSRTEGMSETVHKRALVSPDEIGKLFGRVTDKDHPAYPGLAIVLISGENPIALRRINYYEDGIFYRLFDPPTDYEATKFYEVTLHPPHDAVQRFISSVVLDFPKPDAGSNPIYQIHLEDGCYIREGEPYVTFNLSDSIFTEPFDMRRIFEEKVSVSFLRFVGEKKTVPERVFLLSPVSGHVTRLKKKKERPVLKSEMLGVPRRIGDIEANDYHVDYEYVQVILTTQPPNETIEEENKKSISQLCRSVSGIFTEAHKAWGMPAMGLLVLCILLLTPLGNVSGLTLKDIGTILILAAILATASFFLFRKGGQYASKKENPEHKYKYLIAPSSYRQAQSEVKASSLPPGQAPSSFMT
jgi:type IV secretory pathway TraG/TraD family ATPase VirD4